MPSVWRSADDLLRGKLVSSEQLRAGRLEVRGATLVTIGAVGGAVYGVAMGMFAALRPQHATALQMLANMAKVPLLFLLTLIVAFPSLYTFSALSGSKLHFVETLKLLLVAIAVNLVLLASFAPVTAFFTLSTTSYSFMVLLNTAFFALSGAVSLGVLSRALRAVFEQPAESAPSSVSPSVSPSAAPVVSPRAEQPAKKPSDTGSRRVFRAWLVIYALVGSQMAWILRPFIGADGLEFALFRPREGSFFRGVIDAIARFFGSA
jgi:hypothetical protein